MSRGQVICGILKILNSLCPLLDTIFNSLLHGHMDLGHTLLPGMGFLLETIYLFPLEIGHSTQLLMLLLLLREQETKLLYLVLDGDYATFFGLFCFFKPIDGLCEDIAGLLKPINFLVYLGQLSLHREPFVS